MPVLVQQHLKKTALASAVSIALAATPLNKPAFAQDEKGVVPIVISSRPLGESLVELSRQTGIQIIAPGELVRGKQAPELNGNYTTNEAFDTLLEGTGLSLVSGTDGVFILERVAQASESTAKLITKAEPKTQQAVEEIVVRGKFQNSLIDRLPVSAVELPYTLDTLSRTEINTRGFIRPIDVLDTLPNVQLGVDAGYGNPSFVVRGFDAPVLVNNRVTNPSRGPGQPDDIFVDRYEVLKGPASIALGPIPGGGVINAITKLPETTDFLDLHVAVDQYGSILGEIDINNAELFGSDAFSFRLSSAVRDFEFDAEEVDRQEFAIRPTIQFDSGGATTANVSVGYKRTDSVPNVSFPLFDDGSVPNQFSTDTFFGSANTRVVGEDLLVDAQMRHDFLDNLSLTLRGSYQATDSDYQDRGGLYNYTGNGFSPANPYVYAYSQVSIIEQETAFLDAQLLYTFDFNGLDQSIVVGTSYDRGDVDFFQSRFGQLGPFSINEIDFPRIGSPQGTPPDERTSWIDQTLYSVYVETVFRPIEGLTIVSGIRWDDNEDSLVIPNNSVFSRAQEETAVTGRLGVTYQLTNDLNAFVSFAEAFIPQVGVTRTGDQVDAERSRNYEVGLKGSFLQDRLGFDVAAFSTTRFDLAVDDPQDAGDFTQIFRVTIGEQVNRGVEVNLNFQSELGVRLDLGYGYLDQEIKASAEGAFAVRNVPEHQVSVFGTYTVRQGAFKDLNVGGGGRYFSSRPSSLPTFEFPSVTVIDAFASYPLSSETTLQFNVLNLLDDEYLESAGFGNTNGLQSFGTPRTVRLSMRHRF